MSPTPNEVILQNAWDKNSAKGLSQWQTQQITNYVSGTGARMGSTPLNTTILAAGVPSIPDISSMIGDMFNPIYQLLNQKTTTTTPQISTGSSSWLTNIANSLGLGGVLDTASLTGKLFSAAPWLIAGIFIPKLFKGRLAGIAKIASIVCFCIAAGKFVGLTTGDSATQGLMVSAAGAKATPVLAMGGLIAPAIALGAMAIPLLFNKKKRRYYARRTRVVYARARRRFRRYY